MMTISEIKKLIKFCIKNGIKSVKYGNFEAEFDPILISQSLLLKTKFSEKVEKSNLNPKLNEIPTEEDFKYGAVGYDPRENQKERLSQ